MGEARPYLFLSHIWGLAKGGLLESFGGLVAVEGWCCASVVGVPEDISSFLSLVYVV
jgi:hypothetical protein